MLTAYYTLKPLYGRIAVDDPSLIFVSRGDRLLPAKLVFSNQHEAFRKANIRQGACIFVSFAHRSGRFKTRNEPRLVLYDSLDDVQFVDTTRPYPRSDCASS